MVSTRIVALALVAGLIGACSTAPATQEGRDELVRRAAAALDEWNSDAPGLQTFARQSYAYAMFPAVAKGGVGIGAAHGRGVVWENGEHIGYADVSHASVGFQVGGQAYQVLVVFDDKAGLDRFKQGQLDFSADASGVIVEGGYATTVRFSRGVTIFARPLGGAMGEASLGARWFTFEPSKPTAAAAR